MQIKNILLLKHSYEKFLFVRIETENGIVGWGECSPMKIPVIASILHHIIIPKIIGQEVFKIELIIQEIQRHAYKINGQALWIAISGIETALWDVIGKIVQLPVYQLLGGKIRNKIPMYASSMRRDLPIETEVNRLVDLVERYGFQALKVKIGNRMECDTETPERDPEQLIQLLRKKLGDSFPIMVDANSAYSAARAIQLGRRLENYNIFHFEEPCFYLDIDAHAKVAKALDIPVALGEQEWDLLRFKEILQKEAADIIQPDLIKVGGFSRMKKIAVLAESFGVTMTPHQTKPFGTIANLHLAVSTPSIRSFQEYNIELINWYEKMFVSPPIVQNGYLEVPNSPGIGIEFQESFLNSLVPIN